MHGDLAYGSNNGSHPTQIARDFKMSRERSVARHNSDIIHRRTRRQLAKSASGIGLGVVGAAAMVEVVRWVLSLFLG